MKIFNRGTDAKTPPATAAPAGPAAAAAVPLAMPAVPPASAEAPPAPPAPPEPSGPDLSAILDANVKEMSEKIARLASSLESAQQERTGFEAKIEQMEDRMRKLSSLTEMISAQYNPFVGDAPAERDPLPRPDVGLAAPPLPAAEMPAPPEPEPSLSIALAPEPPGSAMPSYGSSSAMAAPPGPPVAPAAHPAAEENGVYLWSVAPGFETSMLLLGWADMLLRSAGSRESLVDLVDYYHNVGWIGDPARDQLLAYADGLVTPEPSSRTDWRADVEVHEKSLLFVEKLRAVAERRTG